LSSWWVPIVLLPITNLSFLKWIAELIVIVTSLKSHKTWVYLYTNHHHTRQEKVTTEMYYTFTTFAKHYYIFFSLVFLQGILWGGQIGDHPQEDLAKFELE
jgi:hypothetical protein